MQVPELHHLWEYREASKFVEICMHTCMYAHQNALQKQSKKCNSLAALKRARDVDQAAVLLETGEEQNADRARCESIEMLGVC